MTGGEPLMDKNTYRVFDYVLSFPKPDLHLNVTSNFSVDAGLFTKYLDYVKRLCDTQIEHFMQFVSLDTGIAEHAEYIRHGMEFRRVQRNVEDFLTYIPHRNSLTFIITMNNLSLIGLKRQLEIILELRRKHSKTYQRVWFDTPLLRTPSWQSLQILPESYTYILEEVIEWMKMYRETPEVPFNGFKDYEIQRMERDLDWMREGSKLDPAYVKLQRADFYRFFNEHDKRRSTDFETTFPQMAEFWRECRHHAQK